MNENKVNPAALQARELGKCPDRYWYQLNGQSAQQNYQEQREKFISSLLEEDNDFAVSISSEVNTK